ncbi:MAG: hypothetical protein WCH39_12350 [Schlesneria sp.]
MKNFAASIGGYLVFLLAGTVVWAQADSNRNGAGASDGPAQNSKPSDQGNTKPGQSTKKPVKDAKPKTSKSTSKKGAGNVGSSDEDAGDAPGTPDGSNNADGVGGTSGNAATPNWSAKHLHLAPHAAQKFTRDGVNLEPHEGHLLIEATFHLEAIRADAKAVENYAKLLKSVNRKDLTSRAKAGARLLELKNIILRGPDGKRYRALWNVGDGVRTTIARYEISPNSESSQQSSSGNVNPNGPWLDAERSFITRVVKPNNQQPITDYKTTFSGILRTDQAFPLTFLFSVPASVDLKTLKLVVDSEAFSTEE